MLRIFRHYIPATLLMLITADVAVIVGSIGLAWAYGIDLVSSVAAILLVLVMARRPPKPREEAPVAWRAIKEGFAYLKGRSVLRSNFGIDLVAMIFGLPVALFPVLALTQFHRGPGAVGALFAAGAVGAVIASLSAGWIARVKHQGRAVIWAVTIFGTAIVAFGLSGRAFLLALLLLAIAGGADSISAILRSTILQTTVPDELRGRLTSIHFLVVSGGPRLGYLESGFVAQLVSPFFAVVSGGAVCVAGALAFATVSSYRSYHAGEDTRTRVK